MARRSTANAFFASFNAGLLTAIGLLRETQSAEAPATLATQFAPVLVAFAVLIG